MTETNDPSLWLAPASMPATPTASDDATPADWSIDASAAADRGYAPADSPWLPDGPTGPHISERTLRAVEAYCAEVAAPTRVVLATSAAVRAFESGVATGELSSGTTGLLRVTRQTAAAHAPLPNGERRGGWRSRVVQALAADREDACRETPMLLAQRANEHLAADQAATLDEHIGGCLRCQAAQLRYERGERAFSALAGGMDAAATAILPLVGATAAGATPALAAPIPLPARDRSRRRVYVPLGATAAAAAIVLAVILGSGSSKPAANHVSALSAVPTTPAVTTVAPAPSVRHHAARHHKPAPAKKPHKPAASTPAPVSASAPTTVASTPTPTTTQVASTPPALVNSPPPAPAPAPSSGSPSGQTLTQQGGNLGPQNGPTQGIGSGGNHH